MTQEELQRIAAFANEPPNESVKVVSDLYKEAIQQRTAATAAVARLQNELNSAAAAANKAVAQEGALLTALTRLMESWERRQTETSEALRRLDREPAYVPTEEA